MITNGEPTRDAHGDVDVDISPLFDDSPIEHNVFFIKEYCNNMANRLYDMEERQVQMNDHIFDTVCWMQVQSVSTLVLLGAVIGLAIILVIKGFFA